MAVTIDAVSLAKRLRIGQSAAELEEVAHLLAYATEAVVTHAPDAPDGAHNEAAYRLSGYIYDRPFASANTRFANVMRNSGAAAALLPYRIHRLGLADAVAEAQSAVGTPGNPVTGLAVVAGQLVVTFADGTNTSLTLPAGMGDGMFSGTDATARAAAAEAQDTADANTAAAAAHSADANAHHVPTTPGGDAVSESARLPVGSVALRLGWGQSQTPTEAIFTRADTHPTDGAAIGTVSGLNPPPFPPALNTDPTLYLFIWIGAALADIADIRLSGGGGTLIGSLSNGAAYDLEGAAGTVYVSNQRLSPGLSAYQISAIVAGALIASQPWVEEQIAAIPAPTGGDAPKWHWICQSLGLTYVAGVKQTLTQFTYPLAGYPSYAELQADMADGTIPQFVLSIQQNDAGDAEGDGQIFVLPNVSGFITSYGNASVFPSWNLGVNPAKFTLRFESAGLTFESDVAIPATPNFIVRVAVWA